MDTSLQVVDQDIARDLAINYISDIPTLLKCVGSTVALDTETTGLNPWNDKLIGLGFHSEKAGVEGYIPTLDEASRTQLKKVIDEEFGKETTFIFHNAKFDMHFLGMHPKEKDLVVLDTTVMIHLIDSRLKKNLGDAEKLFLKGDSKRRHVKAAPARTKIWDWPLDILSAYCVNDARVTYQLAQTLYPRLEELDLLSLF